MQKWTLPVIALMAMSSWAESKKLPSPQVINLMNFETKQLAAWERINRTSDSLPLTMKDLEKLAKAGIAPATIVEMMRTRKVLALADADTLVRLKKAGANDAMIAALSAYALKPNAHFNLAVQFDVRSPYSIRQAPYLYIEVWNTKRNRQEAFLHADLRTRFSNRGQVEIKRDRSDPLLPNTVRTVRFRSRIKSRDSGPLNVRVLMTQKAGLLTLSRTDGTASKGVVSMKMNYPAVSLDNRCRLELTATQDPLINDRFPLKSRRLECRWD